MNTGHVSWSPDFKSAPMRTGEAPFEAARGSVALREYLKARRKTIEASIGAEVLAGNKHKEECERTALAEITALEQWLCKEGH